MKTWIQSEKLEWDNLVRQSPDGGFLQSWAWGEFNQDLGNAVYNISNESSNILAQVLQLRAGNQWILSIPRGPIMVEKVSEQDVTNFFAELKQWAKERQSFLIRFDAPQPMPAMKGLYKADRERNPVHTIRLATDKSEDELLQAMKSKHRYNIRLAQKKGVEVFASAKPEDAATFFDLMQKTTDRQGFASYDQDYFTQLMKSLAGSHQAQWLFARYEGKIIAGLLLGFFGSTCIYLHGASDNEYRGLMAPHLLQWEAIKEAKRRGMVYDFWGVAGNPPLKQEESWLGISRFKQGFDPSATIMEYPGTYELPSHKTLYFLYKLRQKFKA